MEAVYCNFEDRTATIWHRVLGIFDVDDIRVTVRRCSPGTCGRRTADTAIAAGLVRADHVLAPFAAEWVHRLRCPLVVPEERADDPDLRIRATELIVADVFDHQPVWTDRAAGGAE